MRNGIGITLLALALAGTAASAEERIEVKVGEQRVLKVDELTRLALGDSKLAQVKTVGGGRVQVTGQAPGTTKLRVWKSSGERVEYTLVVTGEAAPGAQGKSAPAPAQAPARAPDETLTLKKGASRELAMKGMVRIAVGDPEVVDVSAEGKDVLRLTAKQVGETKLLVWTGDQQELHVHDVIVTD